MAKRTEDIKVSAKTSETAVGTRTEDVKISVRTAWEADRPVSLGIQEKTLSEENLTSLVTRTGEVQASPTANTILSRLKDLLTGIVLAAGSNRIGKATIRNAANDADIDPLSEGDFDTRVGEIQASPTANTILARLKDLLTGIVLATGANVVGKVGIDQTTPGTTNKVIADPAASSPTTYNVTLTVADTQYSQAMPANCRRFEFQCRTEHETRFAFVTGKVAGPTAPYHTLKAGDYQDSGAISQGASPSTLYLAAATAGVIMKVLAWT